MRIKKGFVLRDVAGQTMVIATGEASKNFHGLIKLNDTGKFIWKGLTEGLSQQEIARKLSETYEIELQKAQEDTQKLISQMDRAGFLVP